MRFEDLRGSLVRWSAAAALAAAVVLAAPSPIEAAPTGAEYSAPGTYSLVVPAGVTSIDVDAWGAQGGGEGVGDDGGLGGRATATIAVTPGETLQVNVGGRGADRSGITGGAGGFNGGGAGGDGGDIYAAAGGGGGASDVRRGGTGLEHRVVVAGGGGGGMDYSRTGGGRGGAGGGLTGGDAATDGFGGATPGAGGTQTAGGAAGASAGAGGTAAGAGSLGAGGAGADATQIGGGGGGGGYWGGGGGGGADLGQGEGRAGGGGSGYGPAGTVFETGVRAGDGYVKLTFVRKPATSLTLTAPKSVPAGKRVRVTGTLSASLADPACTASRTLGVTSGTKRLPDVVTGPDGTYSFFVRVRKNTTLVVTFAGDANCLASEATWTIRARR